MPMALCKIFVYEVNDLLKTNSLIPGRTSSLYALYEYSVRFEGLKTINSLNRFNVASVCSSSLIFSVMGP